MTVPLVRCLIPAIFLPLSSAFHYSLVRSEARLGLGNGHGDADPSLASWQDAEPLLETCDPPPLILPAFTGDLSAPADFPVDVVYTWIAQPSSKVFAKIKKDCPHLQGGWQRMRNLHTLRFSLRMLEQNIPWVRKVFIVTGGQGPDWLNISNPRVQLVSQEDLWPEDRLDKDRPIHNSQAVEVHLHRIAGLAEHFIYFNDDMFVGRPLERSFFFTDAGLPVMHAGEKLKRDAHWCQRGTPGSLPVTASTHECLSLTISMIEDMQTRWPETFDTISSAHCRGDLAVDQGPTWLYGWYGVQSGRIETVNTARVAWMSAATAHHRAAWYSEQLQRPPDIGCINDDFDVNDDLAFIREMNQLVSFIVQFSNNTVSQFEKHGKWSLEHNETEFSPFFSRWAS